jgi:outer membrane protein TolC
MHLYILLCFSLLSMNSYASALEDIILSSWSNDPLVLSQESKIKAAELDKFARFLPNNPTVSFTDSDNHSWRTYGVSLVVGIPGKAFALHKVDTEVVRAENSELAAKKIELANYVLTHYGSCASNKELISILSEAVTELATLKGAITARYEMGQSTQAERIGIELQYRQANIEYNTLKDQARVACEKLKEIVAEKKLPETILADTTLPEDLSESLLSQLGSKSMDLIRSENEKRVSLAQADTAFWNAAPEFTFSYYRNYYNKLVASPIIPVQWTNTFMVSMNIPLLFPFYERSEIMRAQAENRIASQRAAMRIVQSEKSVEDASHQFLRNKKIFEKLLAHDLPMAETMVDSTLAAYKQGKLGFSELILAKRTWLDLKKEEVNLKLSMLNARLICLSSCERK